MKKKHEALGLLDTVEINPKKRTIELKNHTIEISEMGEQLTSNPGIFMGHNQSQLEEAPEEVSHRIQSLFVSAKDCFSRKRKRRRRQSKRSELIVSITFEISACSLDRNDRCRRKCPSCRI